MATRLSEIPVLRYAKIYPLEVTVHSVRSEDDKTNNAVLLGADGIVAVSRD